jgi:surfeit locus 1 family protein
VQAGWSRDPTPPQWDGGPVSGLIAPNSEGFARLIVDPPIAGLEASAAPDPADLPNNHLAYAGQWFFFALTALVIYVLAIRRRQR